ncbi:MAG: DUF5658 family protein [Candidatus Syntropharchaeales archaeon]
MAQRKIPESYLSHKLLFFSGFLTFGLLDGLTAAMMIDEKGIIAEANPLLRELVISYGSLSLLIFKVVACFLLLSIPLLIQHFSKKSMFWTINGFYGVFTIAGILAATDNWIFMNMGDPFIDPELVTALTFLVVMIAIALGDIMDYNRNRTHGQTHSMITDKEWERMKREMNYPD